jgi:hypothetical protein
MTYSQAIDGIISRMYLARDILMRLKRLGRPYDENALATLEEQIDWWERYEETMHNDLANEN